MKKLSAIILTGIILLGSSYSFVSEKPVRGIPVPTDPTIKLF